MLRFLQSTTLKAHGRALYFARRDWIDDSSIQEHLENPFDQVGEDDLMINAEKFVDLLQAGTVTYEPV